MDVAISTSGMRRRPTLYERRIIDVGSATSLVSRIIDVGSRLICDVGATSLVGRDVATYCDLNATSVRRLVPSG